MPERQLEGEALFLQSEIQKGTITMESDLSEMNHIKKTFGELEVLRIFLFPSIKGGRISYRSSGSGKSTLLRCASCWKKKWMSGELSFLGK